MATIMFVALVEDAYMAIGVLALINGNKSFDSIVVEPGGRGVGEVKEAPTHKLRVGAINAHTGNAQNSVR